MDQGCNQRGAELLMRWARVPLAPPGRWLSGAITMRTPPPRTGGFSASRPERRRRARTTVTGSAATGLALGRTIPRPKTDNHDAQIRVEASDLAGSSCGPSPDSPGGYHNIHVGPHAGPDATSFSVSFPATHPATWNTDCTAALLTTGADLKSPYIQGPPVHPSLLGQR